MADSRLLRLACSLLPLVALTQQVDITITATGSRLGGSAVAIAPLAIPGDSSRTVIIATCPNIPPGECCQPPRHLSMHGSSVNFYNLHVTDIAAVWAARANMAGFTTQAIVDGCSGTISASHPGPGRWSWRATTDALSGWGSRAAGASYITLPAALPPDPSTSNWLMMEGLLGLVWGGGKWFSSPAAEKFLGSRDSFTHPGGGKFRRDIRSAKKGSVYARPPLRGRFPLYIEINGTQYSGGRAGDFMYTDDAGNMLNLTEWFRDD
ncbi:MAG: hypothetical protein Q9166_003512 [cf. Caloplaca sp. 2 TL-2023]